MKRACLDVTTAEKERRRQRRGTYTFRTYRGSVERASTVASAVEAVADCIPQSFALGDELDLPAETRTCLDRCGGLAHHGISVRKSAMRKVKMCVGDIWGVRSAIGKSGGSSDATALLSSHLEVGSQVP